MKGPDTGRYCKTAVQAQIREKAKLKNSKYFPIMTLFLVNFIWGLDFIAIDYVVGYISPAMLTFLRLTLSACIMLIIVFAREKGLRIKKEDWPRTILCGALGMAFFFTIEGMGVRETSGSLASLIMATVPVFGIIFDRLVYKNKITPVKLAGILASIAGVAMVVAGGEGGGIHGNIKGVLCMFIAAIVWTWFIVYVKPLYDKYSITTILTGLFVSGAPMAFLAVLAGGRNEAGGFSPLADFQDPQFTPVVIGVIIATTLFCILLGEMLYIYSIGKLSVTMVSVFENVLPLTTVIFSFIIFGEMLTAVQLLGGAVILVSVTVLSMKE